MRKNEFAILMTLFVLIVASLWTSDQLKGAKNTFVIKNNSTSTTTLFDQKTSLLSQVLTTPISYVKDDQKSILVDLTNMKVFLLEKGLILKTFDVLHKGPSHLWFQSPTNYFNVGAKYKLLRSSIVDVYMPYSVQIHQDFFIHGIPYYPNGEEVSSRFSGGCLRVSNDNAKEIYDFAEYNTKIIVFEKSLQANQIKSNFYSPIDPNKYWVRQDFNSPLKINGVYLQHAGIDMSTQNAENVYSIFDGEIAFIQIMGGDDAGFGNTVIVKHDIDGNVFYSFYAHLENIEKNISVGKKVDGGDILGTVGASGYGCQNYWRIGEDGCNASGFLDRHLHFEIKTSPVLTNSEGENDCVQKNGELGPCYGYVPTSPLKYGYFDPLKILTEGFN